MNIVQAVVLGAVEGLTEFLPVSSTGHLTVAEQLLGLPPGDAGITAFTAIVQLGAIAAVVLYFARDIAALATAWITGLADPAARSATEYRLAWYVIAGSVPIGVVGLAARDIISGPLRNLWVVAIALIAWSAVMYLAERVATHKRAEGDLRLRDALLIGAAQCVALVPGVSRSGATISAGLVLGIDRTTATRLFFLPGDSLLHARAIVLARFVPVVRTVINPVAGALGVPAGRFALRQISGGLLRTARRRCVLRCS